jgi:hypothetical protein
MGVKPRWRLTFDMDTPGMKVVQVERGSGGGVDQAVALFRSCVRAAMEAGGCRTVMIGVHVEGAACDHEVGS